METVKSKGAVIRILIQVLMTTLPTLTPAQYVPNMEESLQFPAEGKVKSHFSTDRLENINAIFQRMRAGGIDGRLVLKP